MRLVSHRTFAPFYQVLKESFPPEERRSRRGQKDLFSLSEYEVLAYGEEKKKPAGFFALWQFPEFLFVEHFAVAPPLRGKGVGSEMLSALKEKAKTPIVLEVELPETEIARRRIGFYERSGFHLNGFSYEQPSLGKGRSPVLLQLMSYPTPLSEEEFFQVKETLYREVYRCK